ncbi:glutamate-ammonia-ligase adenylyltransferase [Salinisphaera sp. C84B14]|uniref:hypothetical protein n=1 Tax=Salinisphaera sp. C84B14 TaxID=1304155 RepID=UPI00333EF45F
MTDGERSLTHQAFFTHVLSTQPAAGRVYEIDMRLLPSGPAGMMASHIDAFDRYQQEQAWTWEHQALARARPVSGAAELGQRFKDIRRETLARSRDIQAQRKKCLTYMRARMRLVKDKTDGN